MLTGNQELSPDKEQQNWYWLRVYYFEERKDNLIIDAVGPAIEEIISARVAAGGYFERDWIGGPNILVGLKDLTDKQALATGIGIQRIREYLGTHASSTRISPDEFGRYTEKLKVLEGRRTSDLDKGLLPNNTILLNCEEPYSPLLRPGALKDAVRNFLCRASSLVVNWLASVKKGEAQRQHIALRAMIGLAWLANPQTLRSHVSFRSHAGGFLRFIDSDGKLQRAFSECYRSHEGEAMRSFVTTTVEALLRNDSSLPGMSEYLSLLAETMNDLYDGLGNGRYEPPPLESIDKSRVKQAAPDSNMQINYRLNELIGESQILQCWRIVINLVYRMLNQLGICALERYLACYLVSHAVEDVYGEPASDIARELAHTGDAGKMITFFNTNRPGTEGMRARIHAD